MGEGWEWGKGEDQSAEEGKGALLGEGRRAEEKPRGPIILILAEIQRAGIVLAVFRIVQEGQTNSQ